MRKLEYLIEKIIEAKPRKTPYKHFIIENYLEQKELEEILTDTRNNFRQEETDIFLNQMMIAR